GPAGYSCCAPEVTSMPPDALALYAAVILLLPMGCFFLSAPAFLLVGLEVPEVTQLLRGIFNGYFLVMGIAGAVAAVAFVAAGRPIFAVGAVAIAVFATAACRWFLKRGVAGLKGRVVGASNALVRTRATCLAGGLCI